jgi:hypothetical protein
VKAAPRFNDGTSATPARDRWILAGVVTVALALVLFGVLRPVQPRNATVSAAVAAPKAPRPLAPPPAIRARTEPPEAVAPGRPAEPAAPASSETDAGPAEPAAPPAPIDPVAFNGAGYRTPGLPQYVDSRPIPDPTVGDGVQMSVEAPDSTSVAARHAASDEALSRRLGGHAKPPAARKNDGE